MYTVFYGDRALLDPYSGDAVSDVEVSAAVNECGTCRFTMPPDHALRHGIRMRSSSEPVRVYDGGTLLFSGFVWQAEQDVWDCLEVTCKGDLAYLGDTVVRPYCTDRSSKDWRSDMALAPSSVAALFDWYVSQHNEHCGPGHSFEVGRNDGDLLEPDGHVYRSSTQLPTTAREIEDKILKPLGGYVFVRHVGGSRVIDLRYGCSDVNDQVIDFGVNLTDYVRTDTSEDLATAVRPEGASEGDAPPLTISGMPDGEFGVRDGIAKRGDVLYDVSAVSEYGWVEGTVSSEAKTVDGLVQAGIEALRKSARPTPSIEVKAIDLHLLSPDRARPLVPGQVVRVRSRPHGVDAHMLVTKATLDLDDPSQTTYVLGPAAEGISRRLDESVDTAIDAVAPVSAEAMAAARLADGKRRVFTSTPTPPYDVGDLWVKADSGGSGRSEIMVCRAARGE